MNNNEYRFGVVPTVTTPRSRFLMHKNIRTTFNAGELIPFYVNADIMPGDTFKTKGNFVVRMSTPIYPTMDNAFLDVFFFFTPMRIIWEHWKAFWGENETGSWTQQTVYTIPQVKYNQTGATHYIQVGDWMNYMGLPLTPHSTDGISVSALPLRAYQKIWSEFFRDENFAAPVHINYGDTDTVIYQGSLNKWGEYYSNQNVFVNVCAPVYKYKDYFNACLPDTQKGGAISLPLGSTAPILLDNYDTAQLSRKSDGGLINSAVNPDSRDGISSRNVGGQDGALVNNTSSGVYTPTWLDPNGTLIADLSNAVSATINAQRLAFAAQRILEAHARSGTRYVEILQALFGVTPQNAIQQRPEYLGGKRIPISMSQVTQTSSTDNTSPQGNVAAFSLTVDAGDQIFSKSFTEHGILMGLCCVRTEHSYDTGIERQWSRQYKLDYYHPQLAFLGEQAIKNREIYATGTSTDEQVFGYNERWVELRTQMNVNTGMFSTQYSQSLDSWHYGDDYSSLPVLSDTWRRETKDNIDRTLAVQSSVSHQFLMDCRLEFDTVRCLPMVSVPGLLDHF